MNFDAIGFYHFFLADDFGFKPLSQAQGCIRLCIQPGRCTVVPPLMQRPIRWSGRTTSKLNRRPGRAVHVTPLTMLWYSETMYPLIFSLGAFERTGCSPKG